MSSQRTVCFTGMEAAEEQRLAALFADANRRLEHPWTLAPENAAQMLIIDVDSLYGHMSWLKAHNSGRTVVALSSSARADADHVLLRPVTTDSLTALLAEHGGGAVAPAAAMPPRDEPAGERARQRTSGEQRAISEPARPTQTHTPVSPKAVSAEQPAVSAKPVADHAAAAPVDTPAAPPAEPRLGDYLQPGGLPGPVKLARGDAPVLVLDPTSRTYFGSTSLKDFGAYATVPIAPGEWTVVSASELARLRQELGNPQPFARLQWLAALLGHGGQLAPGLDPTARYRLTKWPQIEREFPKHFRIATTMMKGLLTVPEIAQQSGATVEDVAAFVNASLATGYAETDRMPDGEDAAAAARGGLFGRRRGR